jgi:hypothetical protein
VGGEKYAICGRPPKNVFVLFDQFNLFMFAQLNLYASAATAQVKTTSSVCG